MTKDQSLVKYEQFLLTYKSNESEIIRYISYNVIKLMDGINLKRDADFVLLLKQRRSLHEYMVKTKAPLKHEYTREQFVKGFEILYELYKEYDVKVD